MQSLPRLLLRSARRDEQDAGRWTRNPEPLTNFQPAAIKQPLGRHLPARRTRYPQIAVTEPVDNRKQQLPSNLDPDTTNAWILTRLNNTSWNRHSK